MTGPTGTPVCRSTLDGSEPNCVPWDIFSPGTVAPSAASLQYLATPGFSRGVVSEQVASGLVSGSLGEYGIRSPWASDGVDIVIGAEYRKESLEFTSDTAFSTGDLAGQGAPTLPVSGSFNVKEVFTEVRLPLAQDSWVYDFTVTGGYRYSDYNTGQSTDTYKIEGEFAPVRDFRVRGGYNRAVRAPTIQDLFAPNRVALDGSTDPCAGGVLTAADAGCLAQGLTVGQFVAPNPAEQYNGLIGGNPNLEPEIADTYTAGIVLTPRFLPGFSASVDYFNIRVRNAIQGIGADEIVQECTATADPFFCGLVRRDPTGSLWRSPNGFITNVTQNIGSVKTSGIDANVHYSTEIGNAGTLTFSFIGTWLDELKTNSGIPGAADIECVGLYGNICGTPNPEWRHTARLGFNLRDGMGASVRWRHFAAVDFDALGVNTPPGIAGFGAVNYFDLAFTYEAGDNFNFVLGANNLLDRSPPLTGSQACPAGACNGNAVGALLGAVDSGDVRLVDREEVCKTRRQLFGISLPEIGILKGDGKDDEEVSDLFETTIESGRQVGPSTWRLTTVEGAVWEINNPPRKLKPFAQGDKVVIKKATLGYYFIRINGAIGVKGRRIS